MLNAVKYLYCVIRGVQHDGLASFPDFLNNFNKLNASFAKLFLI